LQKSFIVILAKAGTQAFLGLPAPGFRWGDGFIESCKRLIHLFDQAPAFCVILS
jgi:hypothetical protein